MKVHELKSWPASFEALRAGHKRAEFRRNDRDFASDDLLLLREYIPTNMEAGDVGAHVSSRGPLPPGYTGEEMVVQIKHVERYGQHGIPEGYVVLSVGLVALGVSGQ